MRHDLLRQLPVERFGPAAVNRLEKVQDRLPLVGIRQLKKVAMVSMAAAGPLPKSSFSNVVAANAHGGAATFGSSLQ